MNILLSSYVFHPSVGGIESVSKILAEKFAATGKEVRVITETVGEEIDGANYRITRRPSLAELVHLLRWCDLFFQNNISLRSLIPALLLRKRTLVVHQTWIQSARDGSSWNNCIKRALVPLVTNVAISQAVADRLNVAAVVIGNPYDDAVFRLIPYIVRDKATAFVGRLVSDKGVDLLLHALKILRSDGLSPDLTIVGSGPEEENLLGIARELGLDRQVTFAGQKSGQALAELLNQHHILVIPSRWAEPFGIVALEGSACGCVMVGSQNGGLKEAVGPCGATFENGNERALADCLKNLLMQSATETVMCQSAPAHLAKFKADAVAASYLEVMQRMLK